MTNTKGQGNPKPATSRQTLRLTIRVTASGFDLVSVERLPMITPPQPGERPEAGKHGGHWIELHDDKGTVLAHRLLDPSMLDSVEVHDESGKIERRFGAPREGVFEVLLPDVAGGRHAVLVGSRVPQHTSARQATHSHELARFDLAGARAGGTP